MTRIRLQLTALAPLSFSARRGAPSAFTDTLSYLPGTALRGAAAAYYLRNIGEATDQRFQDIFVGDGVLFANLLPQRKAADDSQGLSYVLPATARSCKAYRGFLADSSTDDETHGADDILARAAAFEIFQDRALLDEVARCPQCTQPAHQFTGFYERISATRSYSKVDVHKRHLPHVGINRRTQTAEIGILYAQQVIDEVWRESSAQPYASQTFSGDLIVHNQHAEFALETLLAKGTILWVGDSRSRGLGRVQVSQCALTATDNEELIKNRIMEFNQQFSAQIRKTFDRDYIALTFQSDAILQDVLMRPKARLDVDDIIRAVGDETTCAQSLSSLRLVYANVGTRLVQSWNIASGYPKPEDVAIRMGSVCLFEAPSGKRDDLARSLARLQEHGIGIRRNEGFGRLTVCDPYHTEVKELWPTT